MEQNILTANNGSQMLKKRVNAEVAPKVNTHVLHSTRIEKMIYGDLREKVKTGLDEIETDGAAKLDTFPSLIHDIFMSFYSLNPRRRDSNTLTTNVRLFNSELLDFVMGCNQYIALKSLCEGRELVAYEAVKEFTLRISEKLDELLDTDAIEELNTLERQRVELDAEILVTLERNAPDDANISDNEQEIERLSRAISRCIRQNKGAIQSAVASALDKAQETSATIEAWGNGDNSPVAMQQNMELLHRVQSSRNLRDIIKYLGRNREILDNARKNSFTFGRGEKYDIVLGNDFTRAISSEYAYLALPETVPLFIQKVQRKTLKQYRKRECTSKGYGDIVVCIDESSSMDGDAIAWAKAIALVLLEHATQNNRRCAMVRFASAGNTITHLYVEGKYTNDDILNFAESFLRGGTDYETPLVQAVTLIENEGFKNADVMFITDGECSISSEFTDALRDKMKQLKFNIVGVVIDDDKTDMDFSLTPFCRKIFRLSRTGGNNTASDIIMDFFHKT